MKLLEHNERRHKSVIRVVLRRRERKGKVWGKKEDTRSFSVYDATSDEVERVIKTALTKEENK